MTTTMNLRDLEKRCKKDVDNMNALQKSIMSMNSRYSREDNENKENPKPSSHQIAAKNAQKHSIFDKIKELPAKANLISQNIQLWARKRKNLGFYKKYLDRVESGLYDKYSGEAQILENQMIDDPVTILKSEAKEYIHDIVEGINKVYESLLDTTKSLENVTLAEKAESLIDQYIGKDIVEQNVKGEKNVDKNYKTKILNATKLKIAKVLMRNGERKVYGYTVKNMVLKGYPTPNHLIVTLFVDNPEVKPEDQPVNQIFRSAESFKILADSDKQDVFNVSNMTKAALEKTVDNKVMNTIETCKANALHAFKAAKMNDKKEQAKVIDQIWDGIKVSSKELLSRKAYIIDCINIYYQMILRIDDKAVRAIKAMLAVENLHLDKNYKKYLKVGQMSDRERRKAGYYTDEEADKINQKEENTANINNLARKLNSPYGQAVHGRR